MYKGLVRFIRDWYGTESFIALHEPRFYASDRHYVLDAIDSTFVSSVGEYVNRFESLLAQTLSVRFAVVTVNGTAALQTALRLAGVGPDTEVITQPLTFVATANAIAYQYAHPVFIDVEQQTLGMSPEALAEFLDQHAVKKKGGTFNRKTGRRISAILPMHTFGHPCGMDKILAAASAWKLPVVEDAAEAMGSRIGNRCCGTLGLLGVLSFNGNKTITCGGGGAILTNDEHLAQKAKHLTTTAKIAHPWHFVHDDIGYNFRMPNLNAALACAQIERLEAILRDKRNLAEAYARFFRAVEWGTFVAEPAGCTSNYWLNAVIMEDKTARDSLLEMTNAEKVMTRPAWTLMPDLPMYGHCQTDGMENARWLTERIVNLPSSERKHDG